MIEFKIGRKPPYEVNAVIEIPKHSNVKYEVHKKTGVISVSRFLYTATTYPYNYGFRLRNRSKAHRNACDRR